MRAYASTVRLILSDHCVELQRNRLRAALFVVGRALCAGAIGPTPPPKVACLRGAVGPRIFCEKSISPYPLAGPTLGPAEQFSPPEVAVRVV